MSKSHARNTVEIDVARHKQSIEGRGAGHLAALVGNKVSSRGPVAAGRDEVGLPAVNLKIRRKIVPASAQSQGKILIHLPAVLKVRSRVPAMVLGAIEV